MNPVLRVLILFLALAAGAFVVATLLTSPEPPPSSTSEPVEPGPGPDVATPSTGPTSIPTTPDRQPTRAVAEQTPPSNPAEMVDVRGTGTLSGLVVDAEGTPIPEVTITLFVTSNAVAGNAMFGRRETGRDVETDADGIYRLDGLAPATNYAVEARKVGWARGNLAGLAVREDDTTVNPDIVLGRGVSVSGLVTESGGSPVVGATVDLYDLLGSANVFAPRSDRTPYATLETDGNGNYQFDNVDFNSLEVIVRHPRYTTMSKTLSMPFSKPEDRVVSFILRDPISISGLVVDERNRGVEGARLEAFELSPRPDNKGEPPPVTQAQAETDDKGRFELTNLRQDSIYNITVKARGYSDKQQGSVKAGITNLTISLQSRGGITGRVLNPNGEPITAFTLRVMVVRGDNVYPANRNMHEVRDEEGVYSIEDIDPGEFVVEVRTDGFAPTLSATFRVERGRQTQVPDVVMSTGATVTGVVRFADGSPAAGAKVKVHDNNRTANVVGDFFLALAGPTTPPAPDGVADEEGRFVITALMPGRRQVEIRHGSNPPLTINDVALTLDETTDIGVHTFEQGGAIRGRCRDAGGRAFGDGQVSCSGVSGSAHQVRLDANGHFEFLNLAPGEYTVLASPESMDGRTIGQIERMILGQKTQQKVRVVAGKTSEVTLTLPTP